MVTGVKTEGYKRISEINGVGYRAAKAKNVLTLTLGYSHPVIMNDPEGITTTVSDQGKTNQTIVTVAGIDKEKLDNTQLKSEARGTGTLQGQRYQIC